MSLITSTLEELARSSRALVQASVKSPEAGLSYYKSALKNELKDFAEAKLSEVTTNELNDAVLLWKKHKRNDNISQITKRTYRILCSEPEMLQDDVFCYHIYTQLGSNPRLLIPLLLSHHRIWKSNPQFKEVDLLLEQAVKDYSGKDRLLSKWKENAKFIIGKDCTAKLAEEMLNHRAPLRVFVEKYNLILDNTNFSADIQRQACGLASQALRFNKQLYEPLWRFILGPLLEAHTITKEVRADVLASAMLVIDEYSIDSKATAIELLKDYILPHQEFGDPRLYPAKWNSFPLTAKQHFIAWLSEEDIRLFFDLIIKNDTSGRKAFWLKYAKRMHSSSVVISGKDYYENARKLVDLSAKGRVFQKWPPSNESSTFIMNFGEYIAVEFSDVGNACFVYDALRFKELFGDIHRLKVSGGRHLKSEIKAKIRQRHPLGWEARLTPRLAELGIRQGR